MMDQASLPCVRAEGWFVGQSVLPQQRYRCQVTVNTVMTLERRVSQVTTTTSRLNSIGSLSGYKPNRVAGRKRRYDMPCDRLYSQDGALLALTRPSRKMDLTQPDSRFNLGNSTPKGCFSFNETGQTISPGKACKVVFLAEIWSKQAALPCFGVAGV